MNQTQKKEQKSDTLTEYILNSNTKKFHRIGCGSVQDISKDNKLKYSGTRQEVLDMGYEPCKRCLP